ncbi:hypothetical protein TWF481_010183 [Arthrobotrys musiformis]|uniref:Uncharacterized protein n=1 Tax=Arthrobotrys musiformis TaxID=47236 RepID=A0AAV9W080_9PEZI
MTRRVHRVPLGPFLVLFLIPLLSQAESTSSTSSIPSISSTSKSSIATSTIVPSTTLNTAASATSIGTVATSAAAEPNNMLITVSYVGIAVGCSVIAIFALTIFFSYRQRKASGGQPEMTDAKKEYLEYFRNPNGDNDDGQGGAGQGFGAGNESWRNQMTNSNAKAADNTSHNRTGSKSSLAKFHFRSSSKSQEPVEPILKIEVTSNPSLRPVSLFPDSKNIKAQQKAAAYGGNNGSQGPSVPRFEVPGKVVYQDPSIPVPPHAMTTSENGNSYKFPPRTTSRRAPPMPLAIRPFAPSEAGTPRMIVVQSPQSFMAVGLSPTPPRRNDVPQLQQQRSKSPYNPSQLSPIQMQPIRPYSPLESVSGRNNEPQPYIPSWMDMPNQYPKVDRVEPRSRTPQQKQPQKPIPRAQRPMSSTTINSDDSRSFSDDEYSSYDDGDDYDDDDDRNYDYRSQVYDSYRRSTDSYDSGRYDDRRPLSAQSNETGWSYGPSHTSREKARVAPRSHAEPYSTSHLSARDARSGSHGRQKTPVPVNANSTLSPTTYINNRGGYGREAVNASPVTPPPAPPPKDWAAIPIKMDQYPAFEPVVRPSPASRGNTPRPVLKTGGLPNNPKTKKQTGWEADLERGYY